MILQVVTEKQSILTLSSSLPATRKQIPRPLIGAEGTGDPGSWRGAA